MIFQRDFKFIVEYGEPVAIRAFNTDGAIRKFLQMG